MYSYYQTASGLFTAEAFKIVDTIEPLEKTITDIEEMRREIIFDEAAASSSDRETRQAARQAWRNRKTLEVAERKHRIILRPLYRMRHRFNRLAKLYTGWAVDYGNQKILHQKELEVIMKQIQDELQGNIT